MKEIVIGMGYGDEGKGLVTDWRCGLNDRVINVRYSGGHQAGHRVVRDDVAHVFSNFGSGTLAGATTYWKAKTFDPVGFCRELDALHEVDCDVPQYYIDHMVPLTTAVEKDFNKMSEAMDHGSVGVGFHETLKREKANKHLYAQDMFYPSVLREKLRIIYPGVNLDNFIHACYQIAKSGLVSLGSPNRKAVEVWESSQGLMLDMDYGFFPHCTPSRLGTQEFELEPEDTVFLVTRFYQTRHGNGPCEGITVAVENPDEQNFDKGPQGLFKKRVLDVDLLSYAKRIDRQISQHLYTDLVITCLDQYTGKGFYARMDGRLRHYDNERDFIDGVVGKLGWVRNVYVSRGPSAETIERWPR